MFCFVSGILSEGDVLSHEVRGSIFCQSDVVFAFKVDRLIGHYMIAAANKFLRIYYAKAKECLVNT